MAFPCAVTPVIPVSVTKEPDAVAPFKRSVPNAFPLMSPKAIPLPAAFTEYAAEARSAATLPEAETPPASVMYARSTAPDAVRHPANPMVLPEPNSVAPFSVQGTGSSRGAVPRDGAVVVHVCVEVQDCVGVQVSLSVGV